MELGTVITIERTQSGLYKVTTPETVYIGGAASTIITLVNLIFKAEAEAE